MPLTLAGAKRVPECSIELTPEGVGTAVEVVYSFDVRESDSEVRYFELR